MKETYNSKAKCPKCRNEWVTTRYCEGNSIYYGPEFCHLKDAGHLHRDCLRCGYGWVEACLDKEAIE